MESAFDCVSSRLQVITYYADTFDDQNSLSTVILITSIRNTIKKPKHILSTGKMDELLDCKPYLPENYGNK